MQDMYSADRRLLDFPLYEDYLDSYMTKDDLKYLRSTAYARTVVELGYRSTSETLSRNDFYRRKAAVHEYLYPTKKPHVLLSDGCKLDDPFLRALAIRERPNRIGILSTIINIRHHTKTGFDISGYIDYEQSLRSSLRKEEGAVDWSLVFSGERRLWPRTCDLGYYHWRSGMSVVNDSQNYKPIMDPQNGLIFTNRHDRKIIVVDPMAKSPGSNTKRIIVYTKKYDHVVLYDHLLRTMS